MKKIKLVNIIQADKSAVYIKYKSHSVALGNGVTVYFSDYKGALSFLAETNNFLNQKLFEVNQVYADLFVEYRRAWFYAGSELDLSLFGTLESIEKQFSLMISRAHFQNGNYFVFKYFFNIIESLNNICNEISALYRRKK